MTRFLPNPMPCGQSRRSFVWEVGGGFAALGLVDLLSNDGFFGRTLSAASSEPASAGRPLHFPVKAKHCIFLFMNGGPSQIDTFDPKPALDKYDGQSYQG